AMPYRGSRKDFQWLCWRGNLFRFRHRDICRSLGCGWRLRDEGGNVVSGGDNDMHWPVGALVLVHLQEALAERVSCNADDGVDVGIEVGPAAQRLDGDGVLLNVVFPALEVHFADKGEHAREVIRPP